MSKIILVSNSLRDTRRENTLGKMLVKRRDKLVGKIAETVLIMHSTETIIINAVGKKIPYCCGK